MLYVQRKANNLCELFSLLTSERSLPAGGERASWFAGDKLKVAFFPLVHDVGCGRRGAANRSLD